MLPTKEQAALYDLAQAHIERDTNGVALGAKWLAQLKIGEDGKRIAYISPFPNARVTKLINSNTEFNISNPKRSDPKLDEHAGTAFSRTFHDIHFVVLQNPEEAIEKADIFIRPLSKLI